ncbi:MAG: hypothetical protein M5R40_16155 [Anaerolineae bacterium]|nr:hypothetical protein [Anaerolineae bacterium]
MRAIVTVLAADRGRARDRHAITPIYALRNLRGQKRVTRTRATVRGWLEAFWRRVTAQPEAYEADVHDNLALRVARRAALGPMVARRRVAEAELAHTDNGRGPLVG